MGDPTQEDSKRQRYLCITWKDWDCKSNQAPSLWKQLDISARQITGHNRAFCHKLALFLLLLLFFKFVFFLFKPTVEWNSDYDYKRLYCSTVGFFSFLFFFCYYTQNIKQHSTQLILKSTRNMFIHTKYVWHTNVNILQENVHCQKVFRNISTLDTLDRVQNALSNWTKVGGLVKLRGKIARVI